MCGGEGVIHGIWRVMSSMGPSGGWVPYIGHFLGMAPHLGVVYPLFEGGMYIDTGLKIGYNLSSWREH